MAAAQILINGFHYSAQSVQVLIKGKPYSALNEIAYANKVAVGQMKGAGPSKLGTTEGLNEATGSFTIGKEEWLALIADVTGGDPLVGWSSAHVNIVVAYARRGEAMKKDELIGCRLLTDDTSVGFDSVDPIVVKCELDISALRTNGLFAVSGVSL